MKELRIYKNSKSVKLVKDIIRNEDLDVKVSYIVDAIGDSMIVIRGEVEEIEILEDVYSMVA